MKICKLTGLPCARDCLMKPWWCIAKEAGRMRQKAVQKLWETSKSADKSDAPDSPCLPKMRPARKGKKEAVKA